MSTIVWLSLGVSVAAVAGGLAFAAVRALAAWRAFRGLRRRITSSLEETARRVGEMEKRLGAAGEAAARLDQARARLQTGLALASVLAGGTGEARALVRVVRGVVPRK